MSASFHRIKPFITISFAFLVALNIAFYTPLSVYAATAEPTGSGTATSAETCTPASSTTGVTRPSGADANTYVYNCAGYWENEHFIFTPSNGTYSNKVDPTYTYNASTAKYDFPVWVYNAPANSFYSVNNSIATPPAGSTIIGGPEPVAPTPAPSGATQSISNTGADSNNQISSDGSGGQTAINNTGASSNNTVDSTGRDKLTGNYTTVATVNNTLTSQAATGNVILIGNTTTGNATSGNAAAMTNIVNLLQSATNTFGSNGNVVTFVANIDGDVNGDLLLNPASLATIQGAGSPNSTNQDLTVNSQTSGTINNTVNLAANSGDVTVAQNTSAGNATTGNAQAVANIINIIESAITSGKSFLGVININGNLNGDILLPPNFVDQLLAANVPTVTIDTTGANSNNTVNNTGSNSTNVSNTVTGGINNNVSAAATSGDVNSSQNTTAGNATAGDASTNITAFNLTGSNVVGSNNLLVFVNVLGTWVGLIVNAPAGATAASLGGGITQNTPSGTNSTTINNNTNQQINNNVKVAANSGDATVTQNTRAGDAKSGDAEAAVNLLNINKSTLSLSNWFGVLFINVFGTWNGSFGVNTAAGDFIPLTGNGNMFGSPAVFDQPVAANSRTFNFVPRPFATTSGSSSNSSSDVKSDISDSTAKADGAPLSKSIKSSAILGSQTPKTLKSPASAGTTQNSALLASFAVGGLMILFLASDAIGRYRKSHKV